MPITENMALELPAEDGSSGTWDTLLNAAFARLDEHDHTEGNGLPVPTAGLDIDADLAFGGFAATGLKAVDFTAVATSDLAGYVCTLFVNAADDELYYRTSSGVNVQLTDGSALNSALLGGFTGDYGSGDEEAEYSSGSSIFNFQKNGTTRAFIDSADIRLFEATSGITNAVKLKSPASLAASYTLTLPSALPSGATKLLKASTTGAMSFTGAATHDGDLTQTGTLSVSGATTLSSTLGVSGTATLGGVVTVGGTLGVTGATTLSSSATVGTTLGVTGNTSLGGTLAVTSSSTFGGKAALNGDFSHPSRIRHFTALDMVSGDAVLTTPASDAHWDAVGGSCTVQFGLRVQEGDTVEQLVVYLKTSATAGTRSLQIRYWNTTVGTYQQLDAASITTTSSSITITLNVADFIVGSPAAAGSGVGFLHASVSLAEDDQLYGGRLTFKRT